MKSLRIFLLLVLPILGSNFLLSCRFFSAPQLKTAHLFGDHMVLQRNQQVPVWGWAKKKAKVTLVFNNQILSVNANEQGYWKLVLKPMHEGGPYSMEISSDGEKVKYHDVMLGEVWICSGQSNMEFKLKDALGYKSEQKNAAQMPIRHFHVPVKFSPEPEEDLSAGSWVKADSNTVGDFTAVGYFYAKQLAQKLHVTIGLINASYFGSQAEWWTSKEAMLKYSELGPFARKLLLDTAAAQVLLSRRVKEFAYGTSPVVNYTARQLAVQPSSFFEKWQKGAAPGSWMWMGKLYGYQGEGFMQKTIKIDGSYTKYNSTLKLGQTDANMAIYINGKQVKDKVPGDSFQVKIPSGTWKAGDNSLLINLQSKQKNPVWFGLGLNSIGYNDLLIRFTDTIVNLADNNWRIMPDLSKQYHFSFSPDNKAFLLYNGMINPLIPYAIAGNIWYQGEANIDRAYQYRGIFPLLIADWRGRWGKPFPFLFVQIASFGGTQSSNIGSRRAELREAQNLTAELPNTGIALTTDISEAENPHPKNKAVVGFRLASKALSLVYHLPGFGESPMYKSAVFNTGLAIVYFVHADNGLMVKDKNGHVEGFELAGADHKFYYAKALIINGNKVKVWCAEVPKPVSVRYAWTDAPVSANLFNKEDFPVSGFRSDNWEGVTEGRGFQ